MHRRAFLRLALAFSFFPSFPGAQGSVPLVPAPFSFPLAFPAAFASGTQSPNGGATNRVYLPLIFRGR